MARKKQKYTKPYKEIMTTSRALKIALLCVGEIFYQDYQNGDISHHPSAKHELLEVQSVLKTMIQSPPGTA